MNLSLVPIAEDPSLPAIRAVLANHGLLRTEVLLCTEFGGARMYFESSWLGEGARSFYGQLFGAELNQAQCHLIYELAVAGNLVLVPDFGPPHLIVCGGTHEPDEVHNETVPPWLEEICFVSSAAELHRCVHGEWELFRSTFLDEGTMWGPRSDWPDR
ncbi:hypothetical protein [Corynebacterium sp. A21]|uniref:hypothetical protein n=1 Tax=Corynebacterium sp. A21 TaxID=3457318 RepID=UPI003FD62B65